MITKMQTKDDIRNGLQEIFEETGTYLRTVDDAGFQKRIDGKWSIAQNLDHLTISNFITALSMNTPKFMLKRIFGTKKREDWNYDEVIWRYQRSLSNGAKASLPFQPKISLVRSRPIVEKLWQSSSEGLLNAINKWTEEDLDSILVPHPIMGKLTVRELLFFTIYHVQHHLCTIKNIK
ncbi:MAG: hypothetical protein JWN78_2875 [Bacteroidota bacterium]|nr:hypothetical protein [Bacteroidota bacterium]